MDLPAETVTGPDLGRVDHRLPSPTRLFHAVAGIRYVAWSAALAPIRGSFAPP